jgi:hypothetical protein
MNRGENKPIVIQFSSLEDFIKEMQAEDVPVVRIWPAQFGRGSANYPILMTKAVNVQAVSNGSILSLVLVVGTYDELYGRPFGPNNEHRQAVIAERMETAVDEVKAHIHELLPDVNIRPGQIHTGLETNHIQRAYWDAFEDTYKALKEASSLS